MKTVLAAVGAFAVGLAVFQANAADDTIKVAYIDPLSGPFANVGDAGAKHFSYMFERVNAAGGVLGGKKFELVTFDNKSSPKESLVVLRNVIDQGIQYITQGNGSHVAGALIQAVEKHNRRNPDSPILFLNYAAVNPALTNEQCSFWHFRFDANSEIKLQAITDFIKDQPSIKKVYLINQDYAHGHVISKVTKEMLAKKRPDIEIVGDDLHPIGKVKDFSPYVAKIKASGADTVITGNWGNDLSLLVKAGRDAGLDVDYLTYYGGGLGAPSAIGAAGEGHVKQITEWHADLPVEENKPEMEQLYLEFMDKYKLDFYYGRIKTEVEMLAKAMEDAGSTDPLAVAKALEGMTHETPFGTVTMRADDHQLIQPLYISTFTSEATHDTEGTGLGWKTDKRIEAEDTVVPTTCKMKRPG